MTTEKPSNQTTTSKAALAKSNHEKNEFYSKGINSAIHASGKSLLDAADMSWEWYQDGSWKDEFDAFSDCFRSKIKNLSKAQAYNLLTAGQTRAQLGQSSTLDSFESIRSLVAISKIPEDNRKIVMEAVEAAGKYTEKAIKEAVKKFSPPRIKTKEPKEKVRVDRCGYPLPKNVIDDWDVATNKAENIIDMANNLRKALEDGIVANDPHFCELGQGNVTELKSIHKAMKRLLPYAVCTCAGVQKNSCKVCEGRGFISERLWGVIPEETRSVRLKNIK